MTIPDYRIEPEDQQYASAYLFNDRDGYLFRLFADRYVGVWSPSPAQPQSPACGRIRPFLAAVSALPRVPDVEYLA